MIIHQIFFDIGRGTLADKPGWIKNMNVNKALNPSYRHILWDEEKAMTWIREHYPQYVSLIATFPAKFYLIDFFRYLVLTKMGGVYIDMDVRCKQKLPETDIILGGTYIKSDANNNVMKLTPELNQKLLDFCVAAYTRIRDNDMWVGKPGRRFLWSVGASMFAQFLRKNKITSENNFREYFYDEAARSWIGGKGNIVEKGYRGAATLEGTIDDMLS